MDMTLNEIHAEIDRASARRRELWRVLSQGHDPEVGAELKALDERLERLWDEHREERARLRWGDHDEIVRRARIEERLERAA
jgi:hypothetical protein